MDVYVYVLTEYTVCVDKTDLQGESCIEAVSIGFLGKGPSYIYIYVPVNLIYCEEVLGAVTTCSMIEMYEHSGGTQCNCYQCRCTL